MISCNRTYSTHIWLGKQPCCWLLRAARRRGGCRPALGHIQVSSSTSRAAHARCARSAPLLARPRARLPCRSGRWCLNGCSTAVEGEGPFPQTGSSAFRRISQISGCGTIYYDSCSDPARMRALVRRALRARSLAGPTSADGFMAAAGRQRRRSAVWQNSLQRWRIDELFGFRTIYASVRIYSCTTHVACASPPGRSVARVRHVDRAHTREHRRRHEQRHTAIHRRGVD